MPLPRLGRGRCLGALLSVPYYLLAVAIVARPLAIVVVVWVTGRSVDRVEGKSVGALDALALDVACIWKYTPVDARAAIVADITLRVLTQHPATLTHD